MDSETFAFTVEWHDLQADLIREYTLTVYKSPTGPLEVAMYDPKARRSFLKRSPVPELDIRAFHLGGIISINGRQLKVAAYGDKRTKQSLEAMHTGVCIATDPSVYPDVGRLLEKIESTGLRFSRLRLVRDGPGGGGPVVALQVTGENAEAAWQQVASGCQPGFARVISPEELDRFHDRASFPTTAAFDNCALCVVRPHAVRDGGVGTVVGELLAAGLEVSAVELLSLDRRHSNELHEVYKGVLPYHADLVDCMCAGPCVAIEVRAREGAVEKLREVCGPHDVDMAKHLRPKTLRARLGRDNARNGVHATDLDEDGVREVSYVFDLVLN